MLKEDLPAASRGARGSRIGYGADAIIIRAHIKKNMIQKSMRRRQDAKHR